MNFGQAIEALKQGQKVKRAAWGGYWFLGDFAGQLVIIARLRDNGGYVPAQPYQMDMLAEDWEIVGQIVEPVFPQNISLKELMFLSRQLRNDLFDMAADNPRASEKLQEYKAVVSQIEKLTQPLQGDSWIPCIG